MGDLGYFWYCVFEHMAILIMPLCVVSVFSIDSVIGCRNNDCQDKDGVLWQYLVGLVR